MTNRERRPSGEYTLDRPQLRSVVYMSAKIPSTATDALLEGAGARRIFHGDPPTSLVVSRETSSQRMRGCVCQSSSRRVSAIESGCCPER